MSATTALAAGRCAAEALMVDSCIVRRPGETTTDPDTAEPTTPMAVVYPDPSWADDHPWKRGPCKVQTYEAQQSNPTAGEAVLTLQRYTVHVPAGSFAPRVGDVVEITAAALDVHLEGNQFRIVALLHKTLATAYRLGVEEQV